MPLGAFPPVRFANIATCPEELIAGMGVPDKVKLA
jgi:hypothetical protein